MTRASLAASLERNWHILTVCGALLGVTGARFYTDADRDALKAATVVTRLYQDSTGANSRRLDRLETAFTILSIRLCEDTTKSPSSFEKLQLECTKLKSR